jgi:hypothetical protein
VATRRRRKKKRKEGEKERWAGLQCLLGLKKKERERLG